MAFDICLRLKCLPVPLPLTLLPYCPFVLSCGTPCRPLLPRAPPYPPLLLLLICISMVKNFLAAFHVDIHTIIFLSFFSQILSIQVLCCSPFSLLQPLKGLKESSQISFQLVSQSNIILI